MQQVREGDEKALHESEQRAKEFEELKAKMEILQANFSSYLRASLPYTGSPRRPQEPLQIIACNEESGSEGLFKAAAIARARNEAREKEHQEWHDKLHADTAKHQKKKQRT
jgi:hypothetical protein